MKSKVVEIRNVIHRHCAGASFAEIARSSLTSVKAIESMVSHALRCYDGRQFEEFEGVFDRAFKIITKSEHELLVRWKEYQAKPLEMRPGVSDYEALTEKKRTKRIGRLGVAGLCRLFGRRPEEIKEWEMEHFLNTGFSKDDPKLRLKSAIIEFQ